MHWIIAAPENPGAQLGDAIRPFDERCLLIFYNAKLFVHSYCAETWQGLDISATYGIAFLLELLELKRIQPT